MNPLHGKHGVLTTEPPGKSQDTFCVLQGVHSSVSVLGGQSRSCLPGPPPLPPLGICANLRAVITVEAEVESTRSGLQGKAPCLKTQAHVKSRLKIRVCVWLPVKSSAMLWCNPCACDSQLPPMFDRVSWTCKCLSGAILLGKWGKGLAGELLVTVIVLEIEG